ncbi:MAG TPA: dienelactone hydrolase family protein [Candidatus Binataceae bacterium]|nr:dienelactone hydrolase family protein [Candidatus Binataceae bacterium]
MDSNDRPPELIPAPEFSRREFVVLTLSAGFALAALPVSAQTITTDSKGLVAGEVKIPVSGGTIPGYRARPAQGGPFPTIVVVHEIFGVHEHIKDICRRLAKMGYFAVSPLLFAREGDVTKAPDYAAIDKIVSRVPDRQVMADLDATVAWAKSTGHADTSHMGITGFCWGGREVWLYAVHNPKLKAAVAWYGPLDLPKSPLKPANPPDLVTQLKVPVLGLYGGADHSITLDQIHAMQAELKKDDKPCEIIIYPGAPHGFNADYRPSYRPAAAKDAWKHMAAWFKDHGVG